MMERKNLEELREKVSCGVLLEQAGWAVDVKESTRRAVKYRRADGEVVITIHDGKGWFDPLSDAKGDVFKLARHLGDASFSCAVETVANLIGYVPSQPVWHKPARKKSPDSVRQRWQRRARLKSGSPAWRYLESARSIPGDILDRAAADDCLRDGPYGSMWAAHTNASGAVIGWEERGPSWRGFSSGGNKTLFRFGCNLAQRICVTEAAIDAISLAALEQLRGDTLYTSTGGGWAPATVQAIVAFASKTGRELVAATDNNRQGDIYADRLETISADAGCAYARIRPFAGDWNEDLKAKMRTAADLA